jgi:hypothetical protein
VKFTLTLVTTGTGEADLIARFPARTTPGGSADGYRARVGRAVRHGDPGAQWTLTLYAKAYPVSDGEPSVPATCAVIHSHWGGKPGRHTRATVLTQAVKRVRDSGPWWTEPDRYQAAASTRRRA